MSGYYLYRGPRLESFVEDYSEFFLQDDPLSEPVSVVVQNAGLGEWLVRALTRCRGAVMGLNVMMPTQALRHFSGFYPTARRILAGDDGSESSGRGFISIDGLKIALYKVLEDISRTDEAIYDPLRSYVSDDTRRWQLADSIAGMFNYYGMNCLPLVRTWDAGRMYLNESEAERSPEVWQRALWRRIFHDQAPYIHLSHVLSRIMEAQDERYEGTGGRIVLFGSLFLGDTGLRFFRFLARDLDVHHFLFTPSCGFEPASAGAAADARPDTQAGSIFLEENGSLAADLARFVPKLEPDSVIGVRGFNPAGQSTMLERLRTAIEKASPFPGPVNDDGTLVIHNVSGIRREVEVLKDRILGALRDDTDLAPTDIGVLAPEIGQYAPYIEAVFSRSAIEPGNTGSPAADVLPHNISDLAERNESHYPAAFFALLALPGSAFSRTAMTELFGNPCFAPAAGNPVRVGYWLRMIDSLHVRWGVDEAHRSRKGASDLRAGSWKFACERLLAGYYHEEGDDPDLLPAGISSQAEAESAGELIRAVRKLYEDFGRLDEEPRSLQDWAILWENAADEWLLPRRDDYVDESERLRIKSAIRDLISLCDELNGLSDFSDNLLPWSMFHALLDGVLSGSGRCRGRYLARGITCASLRPMRAIPFRRIYVLGMNEGAWPGREYLTGFDLRDRVEKEIDFSRESVDRFAFLEVLFSASDHVSFFYTGRDQISGEAIAPAAPLSELVSFLSPDKDEKKASQPILHVHPLAPYDPRALSGDPRFATVSSEAFEQAHARYRTGHESAVYESLDYESLPVSGEDTIEWTELAAFFRNPVRYFFEKRLGVRDKAVLENPNDDDVLEAEFLDWWNWVNQTVSGNPQTFRDAQALVGGFHDRLLLEGRVASTALTSLGDFAKKEEVESLARQFDRIVAEGFDVQKEFSVVLDPVISEPVYDDTLRLPALRLQPQGLPSLRVSGRLTGFHLLRTDRDAVPGKSAPWSLVSYVKGNTIKTRHRLRPWLSALLVGAAAGPSGPDEIRVFRIGGHDFQACRFYFKEQDAAKQTAGEIHVVSDPERILNHLCAVYRQGLRAPLPLYPELADALHKQLSKGENNDLAAAAQKAWDSEVGKRYIYSDIRDCPFRQRFLSRPDFATEAFTQAWDLYQTGGLL